MKKFAFLILFLLVISGVSAQNTLTVKISFVMNKTYPASYTFSTDFIGEAVKYAWYFGDESSSEQISPTYTFKYTKNYVVQVKITDKSNSVWYGKLEAAFEGASPLTNACKAMFTATIVPTSNSTVSGSKKVGFNNQSTGEIRECLWTFGDETKSTDLNPDHEYAKFGEFKVCLVISTTDGCKSDYCSTVKLPDPNQVVILYGKGYVKDLSSFSGCKWGIVIENTTVLLPVEMAVPFDFKAGQNVEFAYEVPATTATTCQEGKPVKIDKIAEIQVTPVCSTSFTYALVTSGPLDVIPKKIAFTGKSSGTVKECVWYFGDETKSNELNPVHEYANYGEYKVCLTTVTTDGCKSDYCASVRVGSSIQPVILSGKGYVKDLSSASDCKWGIVVDNSIVLIPVQMAVNFEFKAGQNVEFAYEILPATGTTCQAGKPVKIDKISEFTATDLCAFDLVIKPKDQASNTFLFYSISKSEIKSWKWNFGDNKTSDAQNPEHAYEKTGTYEVSCSITTSVGCSVTRIVKLIVQAPELPSCPGAISLVLFNPAPNSTVCNGKAIVTLLDEKVEPYTGVKYTWSTGANGDTVKNLCPNKQYIVKAVIDGVCQKSTSFSFLTSPVMKIETTNGKYAFNVVSPSTDIIYRWEFGDGNVAYGSSVDYAFEKEGSYEVKLTAISGNYTAESTEKVAVIQDLTPVKDIPLDILKIYPNPVKDRLWIDFGKPVTGTADIEITDMKGSKALIRSTILNGQKFIEIPVGNLNDGIFLLRVINDGKVLTGFKFLKNR